MPATSEQNTETSPFGRFADARTTRYAAAMSNYVPKPLAVKLVYISIDYGIGAWRQVSPDAKVIKAPGAHYQLDVPKIADALRSTLYATERIHDVDEGGASALKVDFNSEIMR
jgi:hypothetical protein